MTTPRGALLPDESERSSPKRLAKPLKELAGLVGAVLARSPISAMLGLGVMPTVWLAGSDWIIEHAFHTVNGQITWVLLSFFWSIILPGQIAHALRLIRGQPAKIGSLFQVGRSVVLAFSVVLCMSAIPHTLLTTKSILAPILGRWFTIIQTFGYTTNFYILCRTIAWLPLIVDRRLSAVSALLQAVSATRSQTFTVLLALLVFLLLAVPVGALILLSARIPGILLAARIGLFTIGTLACCGVYELLFHKELE